MSFRENEDYFDLFSFPPCQFCKHIQHIGGMDLKGWTCPAYPEQIPRFLLRRGEAHTEVRLGQKGNQVYESQIVDRGAKGKVTILWNGALVPVGKTGEKK